MYDYSTSELATIDEVIEPKLAWAQNGRAEAQQLALDATRLLSCTEGRLEEYKNKGFFKRCWSGLSGKTGEMNRANQHDLIEMQRISWRYLNQLQERSLMTAHAIITVKNNLLTLAIAEQETRAEIERMANRIYERFEELEERMRNVEAASNIHGWLLTLDTRDYDEKFPPHFRLLRVLRDFYSLKSDDWNIQELRYLQQALKNVELPWKRQISLHSFICELVDEIEVKGFTAYDGLISIVDNGDKIQPSFITENIAVPSYVSLFEVADKYSGSSTVIEVLAEQLSISRKDAITKVLLKFVENQGIDLQYELPLRDVAVELLHCLQLAARLHCPKIIPSRDEKSEVERSKIVIKDKRTCGQINGNNASPYENTEQDRHKEDNGEVAGKAAAIQHLRELSEQGDANAQYLLAQCYEKKDGVEWDKEEIVKWYQRAADQGHLDAMCSLAESTLISDNEALTLLRKAANVAHPRAQWLLSEAYNIGSLYGLEEDEYKSFEWGLKAAKQGYVEAQEHISWCYVMGYGCRENEAESDKWEARANAQKEMK